jgi:hypothetical protein
MTLRGIGHNITERGMWPDLNPIRHSSAERKLNRGGNDAFLQSVIHLMQEHACARPGRSPGFH